LLQAVAVEAPTQVGGKAAQGLEFVGRDAPIDKREWKAEVIEVVAEGDARD